MDKDDIVILPQADRAKLYSDHRYRQRVIERDEARAERDRLREVLKELADLMQGVIDGGYKPDSLTLQPARKALQKAVR